MVLIGELLWMRGDPDAFRHLDEAGALLRDTPASYSKAYVLSSLSRFHMIADENLRSIEVGQEALAMAEQMGLDELRAHALDSIGISRARIGDERGIADLEQSIALAVAHNSLERCVATRPWATRWSSTATWHGRSRSTSRARRRAAVRRRRPHPLVRGGADV